MCGCELERRALVALTLVSYSRSNMNALRSLCFGSLGIFACAIACGGSDAGSSSEASGGASASAGTSGAGIGTAGALSASGGRLGTSGAAGTAGAAANAGSSSGGSFASGGDGANGGSANGGDDAGGAAQSGGQGGASAGSAGSAQGGAAGASSGLDPTKTPGKNFDLSHFQLQLPIADGTNVKTITSAQLATYTSDYFYTATDGAMTFWCPVTGAHTANTEYPRSELRETAVGGDWQISGKHSLTARFKVTKTPPGNKGMIIGQVHGNKTDGTAEVLKLEWMTSNAIIASVEENNSPATQQNLPLGNYTLGSEYTYLIQLENSTLTVTIQDDQGGSKSITSPYTAASWKEDTYYFKLGDYVQVNTGADTDGGRVSFYSFTITHG